MQRQNPNPDQNLRTKTQSKHKARLFPSGILFASSLVFYTVCQLLVKTCVPKKPQRKLCLNTHTHEKTPLVTQWINPPARAEDTDSTSSLGRFHIPELLHHFGDPRAFYIKVGEMDREQEKKKKFF